MGEELDPESHAQELFDHFVSAPTCRATLCSFSRLCEHLQLDLQAAPRPLYHTIKQRLSYWRANGLWSKLDRRAALSEYQRGRVCSNLTCVVIGAGPCGLRTAVELSFMGARVVVLEKRDSFSRNNVLHLWPFTIHDLRGLGAKKFYGKFCAGSIDHISIRQLQLILLKVALLLGVEVHVSVEFKSLIEPPTNQQKQKVGWRLEIHPKSHPVSQLEFDVVVGADGRRNTLPGFKRKEFRGKLAIAITANFKNRHTTAEAKVEEISGVAFIFNQRFFQELREETGIDLENIVYYKDDTHYFVMTAKKQSLMEKHVILQDFVDTELLLSPDNVDQNALQAYAREAANFSTHHQLPSLDFAMNHYGQPDVAMFDFTCMYAAEHAAMFYQHHNHQLLVTLVGDSLLEPFWPMGTGIARGFLAALDSAWMIYSWAKGGAPLDVLAIRESLYRILPQTTPENMQKNFSLYTLDPATRYTNVNTLHITPAQVRHLVNTGHKKEDSAHACDIVRPTSLQSGRQGSVSHSNKLLTWCQERTQGYRGVTIHDLTTSWKNGLALCALIHSYCPELINYQSLDISEEEENIQLAFDVAERVLGISPLMTVDEMLSVGEPDSLSMVMYLSQFYQLLSNTPPTGSLSQFTELRGALITPVSLLSRLGYSSSRKRTPAEKKDDLTKRRKESHPKKEESVIEEGIMEEKLFSDPNTSDQQCDQYKTKVRFMASKLQAKHESTPAKRSTTVGVQQQGELLSPSVSDSRPPPEATAPLPAWRLKKRTQQQEMMSFRFKERIRSQQTAGSAGSSDTCFFCKQHVYVMERMSAEGLFFHRSCLLCDYCGCSLRITTYTYDRPSGRFFCPDHFDVGSQATAARKRQLPSDRDISHRASIVSLVPPFTGSSTDSLISMAAERRRSSVASLMEAALNKKQTATPERIELENCRRCSTNVDAKLLEEVEEPQEVSEEMLNEFNLKVEEPHASKSRVKSRSSSDSEEEAGVKSQSHFKSSCRDALELQAYLRDKSEETEFDCDEGDEEEEGEVDEDENYDSIEVESTDDSQSDPSMEEDKHMPISLSTSDSQSEAALHSNTPSTACFVATPDSSSYSFLESKEREANIDHVIKSNVMSPVSSRPGLSIETVSSLSSSGELQSHGTFEDISPEIPQKMPLLEQEKLESTEQRQKSQFEAQHLPPMQAVGESFPLHLKGLRDTPILGQSDGSVAQVFLRATISGNVKKKSLKGRPSFCRGERQPKNSVNQKRFTDYKHATMTEESELETSTLLKRCSLTPRKNLQLELFDLTSEIQRVTLKEEKGNMHPAYVPHALAFKRSYGIKKTRRKDQTSIQDSDGGSSCPTEVVGVIVQPQEPSSLSVKEALFQKKSDHEEEELDAKITRRVQRVARKLAKQEQLKRLHKAQVIQRQLQQVEEKQRLLEARGVAVEKALRGEADYWGESGDSQDFDLYLGGLGKMENPALMQQWFQLVQQKNALVRYESELMIFARELELEDRQSRLQQELRERMAVDDHLKGAPELEEERLILEEMLEVVEQRDTLVSLLEEQRLQESLEEQDLEALMLSKGLGLNWD
ncbi:protein-methionine sulfoxide oxidase mical3b isoform X2 [Periophthalmus magnuspinnatus]|uniref:protein-methionine sulfoxide oxidase mical3b isoform X2 n=1 Tax=Periophthalmus magnuspinnatus TaxID=409849 RepID=UPI002436ADD5|nr:protein-methionine sulfoxide oxidase mical3b isoform X2 [Periophthalmus magnuspinnatus]